MMRFEFDPAKAATNLKKHGVSFADAEGVFFDPLAMHQEDPGTKDEERFIAVGGVAPGKSRSLLTRFVTTISD
jgi:uncharacterized DUF497 family protein